MPQLFDSKVLLFPRQLDWDTWKTCGGDPAFSDLMIDFLDALSSQLLKAPEARSFPDVATFAFFCRRANLTTLRKRYHEESHRVGRGVLFHIAPSNVPVNFAYSLVAGLLSGNRNVVRVSSTPFEQVRLIVSAIERLAAQYPEATNRIVLVRYDRSDDMTALLSASCDVRIIWGGDETVGQIRKNPLPARSFDVTFADRYSLAVIDAESIPRHENIRKLAEGFYNDTYLFDQNACSAPHLVVWLGQGPIVESARSLFWKALSGVVREKYNLQDSVAVKKLAAFYSQAVSMPIKREANEDNLIWRVKLEKLEPGIEDYRCTGGYFTEYVAQSLDELAVVVTPRYQTLAYHGIPRERLDQFLLANRLRGIDRIVPIGATTNFSLDWDGYDLIRTLTRKIVID